MHQFILISHNLYVYIGLFFFNFMVDCSHNFLMFHNYQFFFHTYTFTSTNHKDVLKLANYYCVILEVVAREKVYIP